MNPLDALLQKLLTQGLRPLNVPVPPNLETALGYPGAARFLALYWDWQKDELFAQDGATIALSNALTWLSYIRHARVKDGLADFYDYEALPARQKFNDVFLLDRQTRQAYAGAALVVLPALSAHAPNAAPLPPAPAAPTFDEVVASLGAEETAPSPDLQAMRARLEGQHEQHDIMLAWLEG